MISKKIAICVACDLTKTIPNDIERFDEKGIANFGMS